MCSVLQELSICSSWKSLYAKRRKRRKQNAETSDQVIAVLIGLGSHYINRYSMALLFVDRMDAHQSASEKLVLYCYTYPSMKQEHTDVSHPSRSLA